MQLDDEAPSISGQALAFLGLPDVTTMASVGISAGRVSNGGRVGEFFVDCGPACGC